MKRVILPLALLGLLAMATPSVALVGLETGDFQVIVTGTGPDGVTEVFDRFIYPEGPVWDFRDRESYRCASIEMFDGTTTAAHVEFERLQVEGHDANYIVVNDRDGAEHNDGSNPIPIPDSEDLLPSGGFPGADDEDICGMLPGTGPRFMDTTPLVAGGQAVSIPVYRDSDGGLVGAFSLPAQSALNDETFYQPGNEPGEAYMVYFEEGENPVPQAVLRFLVVPKVGYSFTPPPPPCQVNPKTGQCRPPKD